MGSVGRGRVARSSLRVGMVRRAPATLAPRIKRLWGVYYLLFFFTTILFYHTTILLYYDHHLV